MIRTSIKVTFLVFSTLLLLACNSEDENCQKTITIPRFYTINGQSFNYDIKQEVPCDTPEPTVAELIAPPALEGFTYEVISFNFTPDTGNNTSRLQFEIRLNNPTSNMVTGVPILTLNIDGTQSTTNFANTAAQACLSLGANSSCNLIVDQETNLDLGLTNNIELLNVEYFLTN